MTEAAHGNGHDLTVQYNNFAKGGHKPHIACVDLQAVFAQLQSPALFARHHLRSQKEIPPATLQIRTDLDRILFLDPEPRRMRGYSFMADERLAPDGANVSSVLWHLCESGQGERVLEFVRALPEQDIRAIDFLRGPRQEVMVRLVESFGARDEARDAPLLSDGTLRVLAIAAALLSAPMGSLVVIEEIDNGIHPTRAGTLLASMLKAAEDRELRILLTSHNPAMADALPLEAVPNVVYCYRDPVEGDSRLVRLDDLETYSELVAQGPLGQLLTRGVIERFVKSPQTREERKAAALAWLDAFEAAQAS